MKAVARHREGFVHTVEIGGGCLVDVAERIETS